MKEMSIIFSNDAYRESKEESSLWIDQVTDDVSKVFLKELGKAKSALQKISMMGYVLELDKNAS